MLTLLWSLLSSNVIDFRQVSVCWARQGKICPKIMNFESTQSYRTEQKGNTENMLN